MSSALLAFARLFSSGRGRSLYANGWVCRGRVNKVMWVSPMLWMRTSLGPWLPLFCFVLLMLDFRIVKVISKVCILFVFVTVQNYGKSFFLSLVSVSCYCSLCGDKADDGFIQKCL